MKHLGVRDSLTFYSTCKAMWMKGQEPQNAIPCEMDMSTAYAYDNHWQDGTWKYTLKHEVRYRGKAMMTADIINMSKANLKTSIRKLAIYWEDEDAAARVKFESTRSLLELLKVAKVYRMHGEGTCMGQFIGEWMQKFKVEDLTGRLLVGLRIPGGGLKSMNVNLCDEDVPDAMEFISSHAVADVKFMNNAPIPVDMLKNLLTKWIDGEMDIGRWEMRVPNEEEHTSAMLQGLLRSEKTKIYLRVFPKYQSIQRKRDGVCIDIGFKKEEVTEEEDLELGDVVKGQVVSRIKIAQV